MRTFRRVALLGTFAFLGVGLAICVGYWAPRPAAGVDGHRLGGTPTGSEAKLWSRGARSADEPVAEPADRRVSGGSLTLDPGHQTPLLQPAVRGADLIAPGPAAAVPLGPLPAEPYLAHAQQFLPEAGKPTAEEVRNYVQQQLDPESEEDPTEEGPGVAGGTPVPPPVAPEEAKKPSPAAAAANGPARPVAGPSIDGEGDSDLSIHIPDIDIREALDFLAAQGNLNILVGKSVQGKVSASLRGVDIQGALDAVLKSTGLVARREGKFLFVGTPADFDSLEQAMDKVATRVYRPNYVTAAELQALIQPLLTPVIGVVGVSSAAEAGIASDDATAGGNKFAGGDVVVVRDYRAALAQMDQVVEEIDVRPLQVAIEAMILSVKLDDKYQFGVNFQLLRDKANIKFGLGSPPASLSDVTFDEGGLKFGFLDSSLGAFLDALETVGDTNVIATPRVMVLNKHRAEIQIGEEKGYVNLTTTETSSTQSVEFLKLGAQLRLRPFVSSDGLIRMEIHPELSNGSVDTSSGYTLPNKEVTQVTTNVMVHDGCTVVIGGLMREQLTTTTNQIPLLGNLPLVGVVFRNKLETTERRELLVLITPHIVYEPETCREGDQAACEFHRRQAVYADKMSPIGKRAVARQYFRLAQNAWAAGDQQRALRFVEMAVQFDPLNRAAIDLRSDIWSGRHQGQHTLDAGAMDGAPRTPLDGQAIPAWLLDDLEQEPPPQPAPVHPLDAGQPGTRTEIVRPRRLQ